MGLQSTAKPVLFSSVFSLVTLPPSWTVSPADYLLAIAQPDLGLPSWGAPHSSRVSV